MLGYRSFFTVDAEPRLVSIAAAQLHAWLRHKRLDADALDESGPCMLAPGVTASLQRRLAHDGTEALRFELVEDKGNGMWRTQLTVCQPQRRPGWVWIDVHSPADHGFTATPRLARDLLTVVKGRDGRGELAAGATVLETNDVDAVVDLLTSQDRRGLVFVAGTSDDLPLLRWREFVDTLLRETTGMAMSVVLNAEATAAVNARLGAQHAVQPGTVRTFMPGVDIDDSLDGRRHRFLSTSTILSSHAAQLRRTLGRRARDVAVTTPLPREALRLDRVLRAEADRRLVFTEPAPAIPDQGAETTAPPLLVPRQEQPSSTPPSVPSASEDASAPPSADHEFDGSLRSALGELMTTVSGAATVTADAVRRALQLITAGRSATRSTTALLSRIDGLQEQIDAMRAEQQEVQSRFESEILERGEAEEERGEAERQLRYLRRRAQELGLHELMWAAAPAPDPIDVPPRDFVELVLRLDELAHVQFTGDEEVTISLDLHADPATWARKAWDSLLALEDYARLSVADECPTDVEGYLKDLPDGCHGYSVQRHASRESDGVEQNPKLATPRILPVPRAVDPSGAIFMGAHFKIAQSGRISPRMHYLDDTARTGKVYVGYIGRHLPTVRAN